MRFIGVLALALAAMVASATVAYAATYDPLKALTDDNMRDYTSMSEKDIQMFLETKAGPLKSVRAKDYAGVERSAAAIIYRACRQWKINPKVIIATLQKEQSLIDAPTTRYSLQYRLDNALGAGVYDRDGDGKVDRLWPSFGAQIWNGARLFDLYGEAYDSNANRRDWKNVGYVIYDYELKKKVRIYPKNVATLKLYVYTPYSSGPKTTASIYTRYFGSPLASARYKPVYRFKSKVNGTYIYTASIAEKVKLLQPSYKKRWTYQGAKFKIDTSVATSETTPLYRFRNKKTGKYSWTTSKTLYKERTTTKGKKTWAYGGVAFQIAKKKTDGALTVWKFKNKKTGARFLTHSKSARDKLRKAKYKKTWAYEGVAFYLPRAK